MKKLSLFLVGLLVMCFYTMSAVGENCEEAVAAVEGSNVTQYAPNWYFFPVPQSGKKWIVSSVGKTTTDTYLYVYDGCDGSLLAQNDDYFEVAQSEIKLYGLEEGDTILIYWSNEYSAVGFEWSITSSENVIPGEDCMAPAVANIGLNNAPDIEGVQLLWFTYTFSDADSKIVITSSTDAEVYILTGGCANFDFDLIGYGDGNATVTNAEIGQELLIVWFPEDWGEFEWNLGIEKLDPGEGCTTSFEAQLGVNEFEVIEPFQSIWYAYTVPAPNTKLVIHYENGEGEFDAYRTNCSSRNHIMISDFLGEITIKDIYEGEIIYFNWIVEDLGPFEWSFELEEILEGEACTRPFSIPITGNYSKHTFNTINGVNQYWYAFNAPEEEGKLIGFQTFDEAYFDLYSGECTDLQWETSGGGTGRFIDYEPGEQLYLSWWTQVNGEITWEIFDSSLQPGDVCTMPQVVVEGSHTIEPNITGEHWYLFTMNEPNTKLIISSTSEISPAVFKNGCGQLDWLNYSFIDGEYHFYDISEGEEVLIMFYGSNNSWELSLGSLEPGESCISANVIEPGLNQVPETTLQTYWFDFTAPVDPEKSIVILSSADANVSVFEGACSERNYLKQEYQSMGFKNDYPGQTIHVRWEFFQGGDFEWELIFQDPMPGEDCELAIEIKEGNQTTNGPSVTDEYWYKFTMPEDDSKVTISTKWGYYSTVLVGTCQSNDYVAYGKSIEINNLKKDEEIFIIWYETDFVWNVKVEPLPKISVTPLEIQSVAPKFGSSNEQITIKNVCLGTLQYHVSPGKGIAFDGFNGYAEIPHKPKFQTESGISVSFWMYLAEDVDCDFENNWRFLLNKGFHWEDGSYEIIVEDNRQLTWRVNTTGGRFWHLSNEKVPINTWIHLAFTYSADSSKTDIYFNGRVDKSNQIIEDGDGSIIINNRPIVIGSQISYSDCGNGAGIISGNIDEVSIWSTTLSTGEIRKLMSTTPNLDDKELVAFWDFNEINNRQFLDLSPNSNDGYLVGATSGFGPPQGKWMNITSSTGSLSGNSNQDIEIVLTASNLDNGTFESDLNVFSNDPQQDVVEIPVTFTVDGTLSTENDEIQPFSVQSYPNPLITKTVISYSLNEGSLVDLSIYNLLGQKVATLVDKYQHVGSYALEWEGLDDQGAMLENGLYIYRLRMKKPSNNVVSLSSRLIIARK